MKRLAVINWGIGGLGFYRTWKKHRPHDAVIYLADSGFTPYGKLSDEEQRQRLVHLCRYLRNQYAVTHVMVACNTVSSVIDEIPPVEGIEIGGLIKGTCEYVREHLAGKDFTFIGGIRTIESEVYVKKLADLKMSQKIAQPLSALVERGDAYGWEAEYAVREIFEGIGNDVMLASTHYVAMKKLIREVFPMVRCHDPIPFIVERMLEKWGDFLSGEDIFLTTGDLAESRYSAKSAFKVDANFKYAKIL